MPGYTRDFARKERPVCYREEAPGAGNAELIFHRPEVGRRADHKLIG